MSAIESAMIDAFNGLGEVVDFLHVLDMALASEDGAAPFQALATVSDMAKGKAEAARGHARRALDLLKTGGRHG